MSHTLLRPTLITLSLLSMLSIHAPRAHASWVSHWLGLDHHSTTPSPIPNDQRVYTQPPVTIIPVLHPLQTPPLATPLIVVYAPTPLISPVTNSSIALPITGPKMNVIPVGLLLILFTGTALRVYARNRLHSVMRNLDIV